MMMYNTWDYCFFALSIARYSGSVSVLRRRVGDTYSVGSVRTVFLNRRAAAQYWALASIIPGPRLIEKKNLPGHGLTKVENHCVRKSLESVIGVNSF
jgi:hypothetical protein